MSKTQRAADLNLTRDQWTEVAGLAAEGRSWAQIGFSMKLPARRLKREAEARGLRVGSKPQVEYIAMSKESGHFLGANMRADQTRYDNADPELVLIGVRDKLTTVVSGIEMTILEPEKEAEFMSARDPVSRFAQESKREGFGVREYVSILKDIAKLAQAHMPYRHATLSAIAIKDMDRGNGIKNLSREDKRKRLTNLLEQAGVIDV